MKRCPKCSADYFDNMLEFCLEDGTKLVNPNQSKITERAVPPPTELLSPLETETIFIAQTPEDPTLSSEKYDAPEKITASQDAAAGRAAKIKEVVTNKWYKTLEFTPLILALAHNYWQWLYLSKQNYYQFFDYLLSANFIIWFGLLISGVTFGIISLKYGRSKSFAITALVILAVNLLLFIVPK